MSRIRHYPVMPVYLVYVGIKVYALVNHQFAARHSASCRQSSNITGNSCPLELVRYTMFPPLSLETVFEELRGLLKIPLPCLVVVSLFIVPTLSRLGPRPILSTPDD